MAAARSSQPDSKPSLDVHLQGSTIPLPPTPMVVYKDHGALIALGEQPQKIVALMEAPWIPLLVDEDVERHWTEPQGLVSWQEPLEGHLHVLVGNQEDEVFPRRGRAHPRTPAANSVPSVVSCFHSCSAGCSLPRTISVAPSAFLLKQRICSASTVLRTTGEWVAIST